MKKIIPLLAIAILFSFRVAAQFAAITNLRPVPVTSNTSEKPQSKTWEHGGKHWAVLPDNSGTHVWRLDSTSWTKVLTLSSFTTGHADCKPMGDVVHVLMYRGTSSQLFSIEYNAAFQTYQLWSGRSTTVPIRLDNGVGTATIDIDSNGRMWLASDSRNSINVRWSDAPYTDWSQPITLATNVKDDDICAVVALPGRIGVFWSNQNAKRFGFRTHADGDNPASWTADEVPASQSALNVNNGMADDHMNFAVASDGTLYCAIKTEYDNMAYMEIGLLVRRVDGTWDNMYEVSRQGTRPIVILNEQAGLVKVVYTLKDTGGNIMYRESAAASIAFGPAHVLINGVYNNATSTKQNYNSGIVILATNSTQAVGVLASESSTTPPPAPVPAVPLLASPANFASDVPVAAQLSWQAASGAATYQAQVATDRLFSAIVADLPNINATAVAAGSLNNSTAYFWRVRAFNSTGASNWSEVYTFTTEAPALAIPDVPVPVSPANNALGVAVSPRISWRTAERAATYAIQVSLTASFATSVFIQSGMPDTAVTVNGLSNNTQYYWRVRADNKSGSSNWSNAQLFTTTVPATAGALVGHWEMEEGSGSTLTDVSGYGNHAAVFGSPVWQTGQQGLCLRLNGSGQYATAASKPSLDLTSAITLAAWVQPVKNKTQYIIKKGLNNQSDGYELSLSSDGYVFFRINEATAGDTYRLNSVTTYPVNGSAWMHIAATFDGTVMKIYINGVENSSKTFPRPVQIRTNTAALGIGDQDGGGKSYNGRLDDVRLYSMALTASDIGAIVSGGATSGARLAQHAPELSGQQELLAFPNPAAGMATIRFFMPDGGDYTLELYDMKGARARVLAEGNAVAGRINDVQVDASALPGGLYTVRLQTGSGTRFLRLLIE